MGRSTLRLFACRAVTSALFVTPILAASLAQGAEATAKKASKDEEVLSEVIVTGSSIRGVAPVGSESITVDRAQIDATGLTTISQVLSTIPQFQNNSANGNTETPGAYQSRFIGETFGGNQSRNTGIDLRGLGNDATLILIDGNRASPSGGESVVDANLIPLAALERVEIIADGASAVYGSDAVAGVVNYVLRKDYEGIEGTARFTTQDGSSTKGGSITVGHKWSLFNGGSALITLDTEHRSALEQDTSPFLLQDQRPVGGNNRVGPPPNGTVAAAPSEQPYVFASSCPAGTTLIPSGPPLFAPAACFNAGTGARSTPTVNYYVVPGQTGSARPTAAQALAGGVPVFVDTAHYKDYIAARRRNTAALYMRQDIGELVTLTGQASYQRRDDHGRDTLVVSNATVNPTSPYYIPNLFTSTANNVVTQLPYNAVTPVGNSVNRTSLEALNSAMGVRVKLPGTWGVDAGFTYNFSHDTGATYTHEDGYRVVAGSVNRIVAAGGAYNPYSTSNSAAALTSILGESTGPNDDYYKSVKLKFDGPLFSIPAGQVKLAVGGEWSRENAIRTTYAAVDVPTASAPETRVSLGPSDITQTITSQFAELNVPLVSGLNAKPFIKTLTLSIAGRRDDYSDIGDSINPKYGLTWKPIEDLTVRGSFSTSFRQPGLQQGTTNPNDVNVLVVPNIANSTSAPNPYAVAGANPITIVYVGRRTDLKPQESTNYQFGFDYKPFWLEGLTLAATYYDVDYKNKIDSPNFNGFLTSNDNANAYSSNIILLNQNLNQPGRCVVGNPATYDPALLEVLGPDVVSFLTTTRPTLDLCTGKLLLDGRISNLAAVRQKGIDLSGNYRFDTSFGVFTVGSSLTYIKSLEASRNLGGSQIPNVLNYIGGPLQRRARGSLRWEKAGYSASLFANYTGKYINDTRPLIQGVNLPIYEIGSFTTLDLTLAYRVVNEGPEWIQGLRASISAQNIMDKNPPYAATTQSLFDTAGGNIYGRILSMNLTKDF